MPDSLPQFRPLLERNAAHRDHRFDHRFDHRVGVNPVPVGVNPMALVDVAGSR